MLELEGWQWCLAAVAALLVGCSKTGLPGIGILQVPLMAAAFGGKPSVGLLLPLLIVADCFAVVWYRRHAQWDRLWRLVPWVLPGMALATLVLWYVDGWVLFGIPGRDCFAPLIGAVVLVMVGLLLLRRRLGERSTPKHPALVAATGCGAGFATTLANAAGPIMTLYLAGMRMKKEDFMGTNAWFFFLLNLSKVPIFVMVSLGSEGTPLFTATSLLIDAVLVPLILVGVFIGRWLLRRIAQRVFDWLVISLAGLAAVKLVLTPWTG